jgi:inorganic triphosphatase YgiF
MLEFEIKLQVPASARVELAAELLKRSPENLRKQRLQAVYFDTPSRHLAAQDMALRLRREGRNWVQTLKDGRSSDGMLREEDNVRLSERSAAEPMLDLARHHSSAAGRRLQRVLENAAGEGLQRRFATDVRRQSQIQRTRRGFVELSLDEGWVSTNERRLALRELEIESVKGSPLAVLEAASGYVKRYGLWIDLRSKAQRGHLLADQRDYAPPRKAGSIVLNLQASLDEVLAAVFADCRRQVLQNASQIAAQEGHAPEHVHQIRVGLRRLRTALKLFEARTAAQAHWHEHARNLAALLGESRDRDVLAEQLWPRLREIRAPLIELPSPNDLSRPQEVVRRREVQLWFLEWIEHDLHLQLGIEAGIRSTLQRLSRLGPNAVGRAATAGAAANAVSTKIARPTANAANAASTTIAKPTPNAANAASTTIAKPTPNAASAVPAGLATQSAPHQVLLEVLERWHRKCRKLCRRFAALSVDERHDLRKRMKRLRYGVEFLRSLLPARRLEDFLQVMTLAQDALGEYNDLNVAHSLYKAHCAQQPEAWFAVGWLAAQTERSAASCTTVLSRFARTAPPWRRKDLPAPRRELATPESSGPPDGANSAT